MALSTDQIEHLLRAAAAIDPTVVVLAELHPPPAGQFALVRTDSFVMAYGTTTGLVATVAGRAALDGPIDAATVLAAKLARLHAAADALMNRVDDALYYAIRAVSLAAGLDGDNPIRDWITQFKAAVAASTSLANLQTRVGALPNMPPVTKANVRAKVTDRLNDGTAD